MKGLILALVTLIVIGYVINRYYGMETTKKYAGWTILAMAVWGLYSTYRNQELMEQLDSLTSPLALPSLTQLK
jgi:hypothetical protein